MNIKDWAAREVEILQRDTRDRDEVNLNDVAYLRGCCNSALKAFNSLIEDNRSHSSMGSTRDILNCLLDGKPLTPIEDTGDIWDDVVGVGISGATRHQCTRMDSLFKSVYPDGTVRYSDIDQFAVIDVNDPDNIYSCGLVFDLVRDLVPITMPYSPDKPIRIDCERFLFEEGGGDVDTLGIFRAVKADGAQIKINKFVKEVTNDWVEIELQEYIDRRNHQVKKEK